MKLDFCRVCGRIVLRGFSYCPYCGTALVAGPSLSEAMREPFEALENKQGNVHSERIERLLDELDALELDMDEILHMRA